ncbi:FkbM family methyltransferase [Echinicola marina]|uniref:FkbM family methyltransferase n=1 Tax=Echinicola marina TaxID=2859768 RepID=UPI001CF70E01|nr:FkbM family methyltransferase [Echinicola marina]UCS91993.1 FkbM family methyltransferase [Echinicola marina]
MNKLKEYYHHNLARPVYQLLKPLQPILGLKKRTFIDKFRVRTKDGIGFWLYNNAFYWETEIFWQGFDKINWEKKTRSIWAELSKKSSTILDIGANTGIFSMLAQAYNSDAQIFAFEPQPNIYKVLKLNSEVNGFQVNCIQLALSDSNGSLPFYNTGFSTFEANNTTHGSLNKEWRTEKQQSIMVKVSRLDQFLEDKNIEKVDLVKIDVETLEYEVLLGYGERLWRDRPTIILEVQSKEIGEKLENLFNDKDYKFYWINENSGIEPIIKLGENTDQNNLNYLMSPKEKAAEIEKYGGIG